MPSPSHSANTALVNGLTEIIGEGSSVISVAPVTLDSPGRRHPLSVRVSAPVSGSDLPILLFSHGNGWSFDGYGPLASFWASHGFVVVQPTHLDSRRFSIGLDDPLFADIWRERHRDLTRSLDQLDTIERAVPGLAGRLDRSRIVAAGHSWGAQTVQLLLGARVLDSDGTSGRSYADPRVTAGALLAATGTGGSDLHPFAREHFPFMNPSFAELTTPTLVVAGDHDQSQLSARGPDWFTDAFVQSPGATDLLTLHGGEHSLGGIPNYDAAETTDENPERVAVVQHMTTAYLRDAVTSGTETWQRARSALAAIGSAVGTVDSKRL
ncbi:alpha/beta hydrolase family protein [Paramicrobacterium sp. CJ85]|uniref:alpha/beta hydrolase family protein n=1 Tax=Paramicrobacterium sp. CJ85 TaxID=3445355 RepID=UPI003F62379C